MGHELRLAHKNECLSMYRSHVAPRDWSPPCGSWHNKLMCQPPPPSVKLGGQTQM